VRVGLRLLGIIFFAVAAFSGSGCSFHSTQYEFVKSLVSKKENSGPKKNWVIEWNGLRTPVYAVNGSGYVLFVDGLGVQLKYQDAQITDAKGLLPTEPEQEIVVTVTLFDEGVTLGYRFVGEAIEEVHSCSLWRQPTENALNEANTSFWVQNCSYEKFQYQNRRWLNELGKLERVEFLLKRGYPPAKIYIL